MAVLVVLLVLVYPFLVYYGLRYFQPVVICLALGGVFLLRLVMVYFNLGLESFRQQVLPLGGVAVLLLLSAFWNSENSLRLTPVIINFSFCLVFAHSLFYPPSMIERFARLTSDDFSDLAIAYTRKVTVVWCIFFITNGLVALYTALYTSIETWTFYNGFLAYILMGLLFSVEFLVRRKVKQAGSLS